MPTVEGYRHGTGNHCGSTSLRNLAEFYGWGFDADSGSNSDPEDAAVYDEATCFGLAEGLGFTYFELPESPWRAFFGRPLGLERAFFANLGIDVADRQGDGFGAAWADVRAGVDAGDPVMVFTDLYYLDYFGSSTHFSPHSLLAIGYESGDGDEGEGSPDPDRDRVHLSDSEFPGVQTLPAARLGAAMTSEYVLDLRARRIRVTDPDPGRTFPEAARRAIPATGRDLLGRRDASGGGPPPDAFGGAEGPATRRARGIAGIRAFAADLPAFADLPDPSWAVRFAYQNVERRGTGGGAFRRLYAEFLSTAAGRIPEVPADAAERMADVADAWTEVATELKAISELDEVGGEAGRDRLAGVREDLHGIADREERLFGDLLDALD